jgi:hypothetical protein
MKDLRSFNRFILISLALLGLSVSSAHAAIVTYGNLTSDDATDFITDTVTGRQYSRFDTFNLSYADTVAAVGSGGAYEGWSIADSVISDQFIEGLFGGATPCSGAQQGGTICGTLAGWSDGDLGSSYNDSIDYYAFISTLDTPGKQELPFGILEIYTSGSVKDYDDWGDISNLDQFAPGGSSPNALDLLIYKDVSAVPVPAAVWLFGTALIGLVGFGKRKSKAAV